MQEDNGSWGNIFKSFILVCIIGFLIYVIATGQNVLDVLHLSKYFNTDKEYTLTYVSEDETEGTYEITIDKNIDITVENTVACEDEACDMEDDGEDTPSSYTLNFSDEVKDKIKETYIPEIFDDSVSIEVAGYSDNEYVQNFIDAVIYQDESFIQ